MLQPGIAARIIGNGPAPDRERLKTEKKLESMRTGFLSELELISQQENQRLTFVQRIRRVILRCHAYPRRHDYYD